MPEIRWHSPGVDRFARLFAGVFLLLLLGACATPQTQEVLNDRTSPIPRRAELTAVPFHAQEIHQCGPASLAEVLNNAGIAVTPEALTSQVYLPDREGSLQVEMLAATRRNGLVAYELPKDLKAVLNEVAGGTPVLVLQNLALPWYPMWHYAVVIGYDLDQQNMILRSGQEKRQLLPMTTFEHTWARSDYWAMVALPPDQLPVDAREENYVSAAAALEKTGQIKAARRAYETARQKWPDNLTVQIGLGNTAYALGNLDQAEQAFQQATLTHPESGAAFNNLAQVLSDRQQYPDALKAAQHAVALGGPQLATYQETLGEIQKKMQK